MKYKHWTAGIRITSEQTLMSTIKCLTCEFNKLWWSQEYHIFYQSFLLDFNCNISLIKIWTNEIRVEHYSSSKLKDTVNAEYNGYCFLLAWTLLWNDLIQFTSIIQSKFNRIMMSNLDNNLISHSVLSLIIIIIIIILQYSCIRSLDSTT